MIPLAGVVTGTFVVIVVIIVLAVIGAFALLGRLRP